MSKIRAYTRLLLVGLSFLAMRGHAEAATSFDGPDVSLQLMAQPEGLDVSPQIVAILKQHLRPSDLWMSLPRFRSRLIRIGRATGRFSVAEDENPDMPAMARVRGSSGEFMAVLVPWEHADGPHLTYWFGLHNGRVDVFVIPPNSDESLGPMYGIWRRHGKYLLGVGFDHTYHQQGWGDAEIYVLFDSTKGMKLIQREHIRVAFIPCGFVSATSTTVECFHSIWDWEDGYEKQYEFKTIEITKWAQASVHEIWKLRQGRYVHVRTLPVDDELRAADTLMTAVRLGDGKVVASMIPNRIKRPGYVKLMRRALRLDALRPMFRGNAVELYTTFHGVFGIEFAFRHTKAGWVVRRVKVLRDPL